MGNVTPDSSGKKQGNAGSHRSRKRSYAESKNLTEDATVSKGKDKRKKGEKASKNDLEKPSTAKRKHSQQAEGQSESTTVTPKKGRSLKSFSESPMQKPLTERQQLAYLLEMTARQSMEDSLAQKEKVKNDVNEEGEKKGTKAEKKSTLKMNKRNERGETQMHLLAIKGDSDGIKKLISQGGDVNVTDYAGWTPLHEASNRGHYKIVKVLLRAGANVLAKGLDGDTPLHDASSNGHLKIVTALLRYGGDPLLKNHHGETAIDVAGSDEVEEVLERFAPRNINADEIEENKENGDSCNSAESVSDKVEASAYLEQSGTAEEKNALLAKSEESTLEKTNSDNNLALEASSSKKRNETNNEEDNIYKSTDGKYKKQKSTKKHLSHSSDLNNKPSTEMDSTTSEVHKVSAKLLKAEGDDKSVTDIGSRAGKRIKKEGIYEKLSDDESSSDKPKKAKGKFSKSNNSEKHIGISNVDDIKNKNSIPSKNLSSKKRLAKQLLINMEKPTSEESGKQEKDMLSKSLETDGKSLFEKLGEPGQKNRETLNTADISPLGDNISDLPAENSDSNLGNKMSVTLSGTSESEISKCDGLYRKKIDPEKLPAHKTSADFIEATSNSSIFRKQNVSSHAKKTSFEEEVEINGSIDDTSKTMKRTAKIVLDDSRSVEDDFEIAIDYSKTQKVDKMALDESKVAKIDGKTANSDRKDEKCDNKAGKDDNKTAKYDRKFAKGDGKTAKRDSKTEKDDSKPGNSECTTPKDDSKITKSDSKSTKRDSITEKDDSKPGKSESKTAKNVSKVTNGDNKTTKRDGKTEKDESKPGKRDSKENKTLKDESKTTKRDSITEKDDSKPGKGESKTAKDDSKITKGDSKATKRDSITEKDDSKPGKGESKNAKDDSKIVKGDSKATKRDSITEKDDSKITKGDSKATKRDSITEKDDSKPGKGESKNAKEDSKISNGDSKTTKRDGKTEKDESKPGKKENKTLKDESKTTKRDSITEKDDSKPGKGESKTAKDDSKIAKGDSKATKRDSITEKDDSKPGKGESKNTKGDSKITKGDSKATKRDSITEKDDSKITKGDSKATKRDSITEKDDSKPGKGESKTAKDDGKITKGDSKVTKRDSITEKDDSKPGKGESKTANDDSKTTKGDSKATKRDSITEKDDSKPGKGDSKATKRDSMTEKDDSKPGKGESKTAKDDSKITKGDIKATKRDSITEKDDSQPGKGESKTAKDDSKITKVDSKATKRATITEKDDSKITKGDGKATKRDSIVEKDDSKPGKGESKTAKDDNKVTKGDSKGTKRDILTEKDDSKPGKGESKTAKDDSKITKVDSKATKRDSITEKDESKPGKKQSKTAKNDTKVAGDDNNYSNDDSNNGMDYRTIEDRKSLKDTSKSPICAIKSPKDKNKPAKGICFSPVDTSKLCNNAIKFVMDTGKSFKAKGALQKDASTLQKDTGGSPKDIGRPKNELCKPAKDTCKTENVEGESKPVIDDIGTFETSKSKSCMNTNEIEAKVSETGSVTSKFLAERSSSVNNQGEIEIGKNTPNKKDTIPVDNEISKITKPASTFVKGTTVQGKDSRTTLNDTDVFTKDSIKATDEEDKSLGDKLPSALTMEICKSANILNKPKITSVTLTETSKYPKNSSSSTKEAPLTAIGVSTPKKDAKTPKEKSPLFKNKSKPTKETCIQVKGRNEILKNNSTVTLDIAGTSKNICLSASAVDSKNAIPDIEERSIKLKLATKDDSSGKPESTDDSKKLRKNKKEVKLKQDKQRGAGDVLCLQKESSHQTVQLSALRRKPEPRDLLSNKSDSDSQSVMAKSSAKNPSTNNLFTKKNTVTLPDGKGEDKSEFLSVSLEDRKKFVDNEVENITRNLSPNLTERHAHKKCLEVEMDSSHAVIKNHGNDSSGGIVNGIQVCHVERMNSEKTEVCTMISKDEKPGTPVKSTSKFKNNETKVSIDKGLNRVKMDGSKSIINGEKEQNSIINGEEEQNSIISEKKPDIHQEIQTLSKGKYSGLQVSDGRNNEKINERCPAVQDGVPVIPTNMKSSLKEGSGEIRILTDSSVSVPVSVVKGSSELWCKQNVEIKPSTGSRDRKVTISEVADDHRAENINTVSSSDNTGTKDGFYRARKRRKSRSQESTEIPSKREKNMLETFANENSGFAVDKVNTDMNNSPNILGHNSKKDIPVTEKCNHNSVPEDTLRFSNPRDESSVVKDHVKKVLDFDSLDGGIVNKDKSKKKKSPFKLKSANQTLREHSSVVNNNNVIPALFQDAFWGDLSKDKKEQKETRTPNKQKNGNASDSDAHFENNSEPPVAISVPPKRKDERMKLQNSVNETVELKDKEKRQLTAEMTDKYSKEQEKVSEKSIPSKGDSEGKRACSVPKKHENIGNPISLEQKEHLVKSSAKELTVEANGKRNICKEIKIGVKEENSELRKDASKFEEDLIKINSQRKVKIVSNNAKVKSETMRADSSSRITTSLSCQVKDNISIPQINKQNTTDSERTDVRLDLPETERFQDVSNEGSGNIIGENNSGFGKGNESDISYCNRLLSACDKTRPNAEQNFTSEVERIAPLKLKRISTVADRESENSNNVEAPAVCNNEAVKIDKKYKKKSKKSLDFSHKVDVCEADTGTVESLKLKTNDLHHSSATEIIAPCMQSQHDSGVAAVHNMKESCGLSSEDTNVDVVSTTNTGTCPLQDDEANSTQRNGPLASNAESYGDHENCSIEGGIHSRQKDPLHEVRSAVLYSNATSSNNSMAMVQPNFSLGGTSPLSNGINSTADISEKTTNAEKPSCAPSEVTTIGNTCSTGVPDSSTSRTKECPEKKIVEIGIEIVESYSDTFDNINSDLISPKATTSFESITPSINCAANDYLSANDINMVDIMIHEGCHADNSQLQGAATSDRGDKVLPSSTNWNYGAISEPVTVQACRVQSGVITMSGMDGSFKEEQCLQSQTGVAASSLSSVGNTTCLQTSSPIPATVYAGRRTSLSGDVSPQSSRVVDMEPCDIVQTMMKSGFPDCDNSTNIDRSSILAPDSTCTKNDMSTATQEAIDAEVTSTEIEDAEKRHTVCVNLETQSSKLETQPDSVFLPKRRPKTPPSLSTWRQVVHAKCKFLKCTDEEFYLLGDSVMGSKLYKLRGSRENGHTFKEGEKIDLQESLHERHLVEMEKLHLCMEQELMRVQSRCKLLWSEKVPVSACSTLMFQEDEIYKKLPENVSSRCQMNHVEDIENLRIALINNTLERYVNMEKNLLRRQQIERESLETHIELWKLIHLGWRGLLKGRYRQLKKLSGF